MEGESELSTIIHHFHFLTVGTITGQHLKQGPAIPTLIGCALKPWVKVSPSFPKLVKYVVIATRQETSTRSKGCELDGWAACSHQHPNFRPSTLWLIFFMGMNVLPVFMYVNHVCAWCSETRGGCWIPWDWTYNTDGCELLWDAGNWSRVSARATSAPPYWTTSLAPSPFSAFDSHINGSFCGCWGHVSLLANCSIPTGLQESLLLTTPWILQLVESVLKNWGHLCIRMLCFFSTELYIM